MEDLLGRQIVTVGYEGVDLPFSLRDLMSLMPSRRPRWRLLGLPKVYDLIGEERVPSRVLNFFLCREGPLKLGKLFALQ